MATQVGVGISHHRNPAFAGQEAAQQALDHAALERPDFVLVFATMGYKQEAILHGVRSITGDAPLCGCSGAGVIVGSHTDESNFSVAVAAIGSDELRFQNGIATGMAADPYHSGQQIGQAVLPALADHPDEARALLVFPDFRNCNFDQIVAGFEALVGPGVPMVGGFAGDNWMGKNTAQYYNNQVSDDSIAWALLSGNVHLFSTFTHGCMPVGIERTITRAKGNRIYEIDGRPVLDVLSEYVSTQQMDMPDWLRTSVSTALGFRAPAFMNDQEAYIIRYMPDKDDADGSVIITTEVAEGTSVWIMRRDYDKMAAGIDATAATIQHALNGRPPRLVLHFDCVGRGKVFLRDEQRTALLTRLQQHVGTAVPWFGFYTFGEIGPAGGQNCFHSYTALLAVLS